MLFVARKKQNSYNVMNFDKDGRYFIMRDYYFLLSSITSAEKGEKILQKNGYRAHIFKDSVMNPYGCGYVIKASGNRENMETILKNSGVRVNEIREV